MIINGFRFGMILQLAIGPVCMFVFQTGVTSGFFPAFSAVLGTVLIDGTEIILAIVGIGALLQKNKKAQTLLKYGGAAILIIFCMSNILGAFSVDILPGLAVGKSTNVFMQSVLLALSNPLTIVFWAGIFAAKIIEENMKQADLKYFGFGCVLSTLFFLSLVSAVGAFSQVILPQIMINALNVIVGCVMISFGIKNAMKKDLQ